MSYDPKPGSVPFRALAYMATLDKGAEVATAGLATAIGYANAGSLTAVLQDARNAGAIFARQKGGHPKSPLFWSLVNHGQAAPVTRDLSKADEATVEEAIAAPAPAPEPGPQFLPVGVVRRRQTQQRYREEVAAEAPAVDAITLTVRVATLHQAERVMQLVREMAA